MKNPAVLSIVLGLLSCVSVLHAEEPGKTGIHLSAGQMRFLPFLEMVSEKLDLQIDASGPEEGFPASISVPETGAVSLERAKALVLTALHLSGFTWIHDSTRDLYRVMRERDARDQELPFLTEETRLPDSDLLVTYVMPLKYMPSEHVARNFRSFMPANSRIIPDESTGSVLITDTGHNIAKLSKLLQQLDTPEGARVAKEQDQARASRKAEPCAAQFGPAGFMQPPPVVLIALFSLIALVIGFLGRGYVIRRIEGGL